MLQIIVDRLKDKAPALTAVETAENLDALEKGTAPRSGTTFVLPFRERPEPNPYGAGAFRQLVHVQFLTALIIRRYDDATGGKKVSMFDTLKGRSSRLWPAGLRFPKVNWSKWLPVRRHPSAMA